MYPDHPEVITCWVEGVCPMIAEEEPKAHEKVVEVSIRRRCANV